MSKRTLEDTRIGGLVVDYHPKSCGTTTCQFTHRKIIDNGYEAVMRDGLVYYFMAPVRGSIGRLGQLAKIPRWLA